MAKKYLDDIGLSHFFDKLKLLFATKDTATQSANGLMSSSDKAKLDGIEPLTSSGNGTSVSVGSASCLESLVVYGAALQNGSPTPANPVPVQVVGVDENNQFGILVNNVFYSIDLQGNVIASLPDGTKDVLTIDACGHCVLTKRVGYVSTSALSSHVAAAAALTSYVRIACTNAISDNPAPANTPALNKNGYCNVARFTGAGYSSNTLHCYAHTTTFYIFAPIGDKSTWDTTTAAEWLTEHGVYAYYTPANEHTIDLGYIDMPDIPDNASITITASLTPEISAGWWTNYAEPIARTVRAIKDLML